VSLLEHSEGRAGLPEALQFEASALTVALTDERGALDVVDLLRRDDFTAGDHKQVFCAVQELAGKGEPVNLVSVGAWLEAHGMDGKAARTLAGDLAMGYGIASELRYYVGEIHGAATRRNLIVASRQIEGLARDASRPVTEVCDEAERTVYGTRRVEARAEFVSAAHLAMDTLDSIIAQQTRGKLAGVTTGFRTLDRMLGGWEDGEFNVLAARPSMGKTALMLAMAYLGALEDNPQGIFSLEMPSEKLMRRLQFMVAGIDAQRAKDNALTNSDIDALSWAAGKIGKLPLYFSDTLIDRPIGEIRAAARQFLRRTDVSVIWLDHLHRIPVPKGAENANQAYSEIARSLKSAARETGKAWNVLAQLSRNVERREDKRPMLSDLRESGTIEAEADKVLGIYRAAYYQRKDDDGEFGSDEAWPSEAEILVLKSRDGAVGTRKLWFDGRCGSFSESATRHGDADAPPARVRDRWGGDEG
jgi:replicative DNA helicase